MDNYQIIHRAMKAAALSLSLCATGACAVDHLGDPYGYLDTEKFTVFAFSQNISGEAADPQLLELAPDMNIRAVQKWHIWGDEASDYRFSNVGLYHNKGITLIAGGTAVALFEDEVTKEQFDDMATRDATNEKVVYSEGRHNGSLANQAFREHVFDYIKIQIDGGVDGVSMDEVNGAGCQGGEKWSWNGNECFDDYFIADFNRYLLAKYPEYTAADWKAKFGMTEDNIISASVPADDLENNFNYRKYLAAQGFAEDPLNAENPMAAEWGRVVANRMIPFFGGFLEQAFDRYWYDLIVRIRDYARLTQGREIYVTSNGIVPYVDFNSFGVYSWNPDNNGAEAPYVPVRDGHLQGSVSLQPYFKTFREYSRTVSNSAPLVYFLDWPTEMIFAYHSLPTSERMDYWRIYAAEAYANGIFFAFHLKTSMSGFDDRMPQAYQQGMMEFFKEYAHFYRVNANYYHQVTPVEKAVTVSAENIRTSVMSQPDQQRLVLHLNNHNYQHQIIPLHDLTVTVPLETAPAQVSMVSPDFVGRKLVPFTFSNGMLALKVESLAFYNMIDIALAPPQPQITCSIGSISSQNDSLTVSDISVVNRAADDTRGWNACLTLSEEIGVDKVWGIAHVIPQGNSVCFANASYNGVLSTNAAANFGFIATLNGESIDVLGCVAEPFVAKPDEPLDCQYTVTENWDSGFVAEVAITNKTDKPLQGWSVQYKLGQNASVSGMWNTELKQGEDGKVTAQSLAWNAQMASGESRTFGMIVTKSVAGEEPALEITGGDCMVTEFLDDLLQDDLEGRL